MFWRNKLTMTHSRLPQGCDNLPLQSYKKGEWMAERSHDTTDGVKGHGSMLGAGNQVLVCEASFYIMLASVEAAGTSSGGPGSVGQLGPAVQDFVARMDPLAYATDEEAKSYDECNDSLRGTRRDIAGAQRFNKGGTLRLSPGLGARGAEALPVSASSDDNRDFRCRVAES